ncbi:inorganic pyrophosphatase-like isoform X2 [Contarinia nasturtii]|uniref:inorganic pyrophosphatase-like isoform X2 n=1 Tax=Contarinia nasturtii TaxID=265458 RepID=UPI0012D4A678|nr:inorganic pyrophosphatase-like isoform X2 [Contarinia nasturtii]
MNGTLLALCLGILLFAYTIQSAQSDRVQYIAVEKGTPNSKNYRIYYTNQDGHAISPMHDIPLFVNGSQNVYNMVVEIPRWTQSKMEISLSETLNPIKQDVKKEKLRYVANCFPHHGYIWNYGAFPQTWENPQHTDPSTGCKGDNDPIDVIEIGSRVAKRAQVLQVKVLGILALIDEGETDWKVITIDVNDPKANQVNEITDVEKVFPGLLKATVDWFKIYKIPDGKPPNEIAFNDTAQNATFANEIVRETHAFWKSLIMKNIESDKISLINTAVNDSPFVIPQAEADQIMHSAAEWGTAEPVPDTIDTWHYITL